ncbi:MAG: hypothetical protein WCT23_10055, partial [Candidatus Neomarinimicrobiota bacterium]
MLNKRLLSVDFIRGISILGVLFLHHIIYGTWYTESIALAVISTPALILLSPLMILATWAGGFAIISGLTNTFTSARRLSKAYSMKETIKPIIMNSIFLLLVDPIRTIIFNRPGHSPFSGKETASVFSSLIQSGEWAWPSIDRVFAIGALPMIGISGLVTALFIYLLFRKDGVNKVKRNVSILIIVGLIIVFFSDPLSHWAAKGVPILYAKGGISIFFSYVLQLFFGAQLSFFPLGSFVFFGMMYSILLINHINIKIIKKIGRYLGFGLLVFFVISLIFLIRECGISGEDPIDALFDYKIFPRTLMFLNLGLMNLITIGLINKIEYASDEKRNRFAEKSIWVRRFSMASLTFYVIEATPSMFLSELFHKWFGGKALWTLDASVNPFMSNVFAIILFSV